MASCRGCVLIREMSKERRRDGVHHAFGGSDPARPGDRSGRTDCRQSLVCGAGGRVWEGERLVEVLVGPATFDVPSPVSGRLAEIRGLEDDRVEAGSVLGLVATADDGCTRGPGASRSPERPVRGGTAVKSPHDMTTFHERSAGVIPYRAGDDQEPLYLILHSATVRNPRAKWEFPKGGVESGESTRQAAAREFTRRRRWSTGPFARIRADPLLHLHPPGPQGRSRP